MIYVGFTSLLEGAFGGQELDQAVGMGGDPVNLVCTESLNEALSASVSMQL